MPTVLEQRGSTRSVIQTVALRLFGAKGFEGTSLREIADSLEVSKAAIYYHFPSKDAILHAIVDPVLNATDDVLRRAESEGWSPVDVLTGLLDVMIHHHEVVIALAHDIGAEARLQAHGVGGDQEERLISLLAGPTPALGRRAGAVGAVGALRGGLIEFADRLGDAKPYILASALGALGVVD